MTRGGTPEETSFVILMKVLIVCIHRTKPTTNHTNLKLQVVVKAVVTVRPIKGRMDHLVPFPSALINTGALSVFQPTGTRAGPFGSWPIEDLIKDQVQTENMGFFF